MGVGCPKGQFWGLSETIEKHRESCCGVCIAYTAELIRIPLWGPDLWTQRTMY